MKKNLELKCSFCGVKVCCCDTEKQLPTFCPMNENQSLIDTNNSLYLDDGINQSLARESAKIESEGYCQWTRIEETIQFAKRLEVKNIGIAHCEGLMKEAQIVHKIISSHGFKVNSVCCKVGKLNKEELGIQDHEKVRPGQFETACNPINQAKLLEQAGSEFNIVIGLCVGHDSLFFMHSKVPTTVLIVKDRVLGHNPVAALYTNHSYYKKLNQ